MRETVLEEKIKAGSTECEAEGGNGGVVKEDESRRLSFLPTAPATRTKQKLQK